jgi:hypothetical protein
MMKDYDAVGNHNGPEAIMNLALDEDAIAGNRIERHTGVHIDAITAILNKESRFVDTPVVHSGFEGGWRILGSLRMREHVNGVQGGQRRGLCLRGGSGTSDNDNER